MYGKTAQLYFYIYLFIYQIYTLCHYRGVSGQQGQEKKQEGNNEEKRIESQGEIIHPNSGN